MKQLNLYKTKTQRDVTTTEKTANTEEKNNDETLVYSVGDLAKSLFSKMGCCKKDKHFQNKEILLLQIFLLCKIFHMVY